MAPRKEMEVVKGLDIARYMGRWYEIASFPSIFQPRNGENTRANYTFANDTYTAECYRKFTEKLIQGPGLRGGKKKKKKKKKGAAAIIWRYQFGNFRRYTYHRSYTLNPDGTVHVLNETFTNGKRDSIEGTAYKADPSSDEAKLKVKFYVPPFLPIIPVVGNYWVLYIDDNYQYALIGEPTRKNLWILCRQTHLDEEVYGQLVQRATDEGYDVSKLHRTPQADTPPSDGDAPNDKKGIWWIKSLFGK